ncbi:hypothetical protein DFJ74DRAFT_672761 [Hyaloraphidium curvatum]|nr:hypothetical protein DFJ74DRAFT_672761 [Hyaloraphidium curvatum]
MARVGLAYVPHRRRRHPEDVRNRPDHRGGDSGAQRGAWFASAPPGTRFTLPPQLGASCVPAWAISSLAVIAYFLLSNLYDVAVQNAHIDGIAALYLAAADRISLLLIRPAPPGADRELVAYHASVLRTYADPTRYRARFLGFVVTFGAIRTLLLAAFTVAVGLVGLLRGGGVTVTLQSVCPG